MTRSIICWRLLVLLASIAPSFATTSFELSAQLPAAWKTLFDGKDLNNFTQTGAAQWKIDNGAIVGGRAEPGQRGRSLRTKGEYKDLELELDFMLAEHDTYNSGISLRTGYQVNIGRHESGEFIGVVVHRATPESIRGNVLWLDKGDQKFPNLRKKEDWNHLRITFQGPRLEVWLNGTQICDVTDNSTDPAEAKWKEAGPISFQWPPAGEAGGFAGYVKFRNIRVREP